MHANVWWIRNQATNFDISNILTQRDELLAWQVHIRARASRGLAGDSPANGEAKRLATFLLRGREGS